MAKGPYFVATGAPAPKLSKQTVPKDKGGKKNKNLIPPPGHQSVFDPDLKPGVPIEYLLREK